MTDGVSLVGLARSFLEAERYQVADRRDLLKGTRASVGGGTESVLLWVLESHAPEELRSRERSLLAAFGEANESDPTARKFLLVDSYEGFSADFRRDARKWFDVRVTVPAFFFDTNFAWESAREAPSAAKALRERGENTRRRRIWQPYRTAEGNHQGDDLLRVLMRTLTASSAGGPTVHVVAGPAGVGKSFLFESLYADLYQRFLDNKRAQILSPRPLPLTPEYLGASDAQTVRALTRAFLETEFVRRLDMRAFEWMLTHGTAMWLLDGLDEVIGQDPGFFSDVLELLTMPGATSSPLIVICIRDSLLSTDDDLRDLCEEYRDTVQTYYLLDWGMDSRRQFSTARLPTKSEQFLSTLSARKDLDSLASTPYYCSLLADLYDQGELLPSYSKAALLDHALSSIIQREYDKGLLSPSVAPEESLVELLEAVALVDLDGGFRGIDVAVAAEFAAVILPSQMSEEEQERLVSHLKQLATFASSEPSKLRFAQEILEQYVLALAIIRAFNEKQDAVRHRLSYREIPREWITLEVIAEHIRRVHIFDLLPPLLYSSLNNPVAFKNLIQIAAYAKPSQDALKLPDLSFERQDLSGLLFEDCDLTGRSFRGADLTNTTFRGCNLAQAEFQEAILKGTVFHLVDENALRGAKVGDLSRFFSLRDEARDRLIDRPDAARKWFQERTGSTPRIVEPCAAAQQLRHLFGKFVYPTGAFRRSRLDRRGTLAGKRYYAPDQVLNAAIRARYLLEGDRGRIERPEGELYSELVNYTRDLTVSPGLRALLSEVCSLPGCPHVPPAR
jgi:uncharacterized protein YjbI with pentapeptide repeats